MLKWFMKVIRKHFIFLASWRIQRRLKQFRDFERAMERRDFFDLM